MRQLMRHDIQRHMKLPINRKINRPTGGIPKYPVQCRFGTPSGAWHLLTALSAISQAALLAALLQAGIFLCCGTLMSAATAADAYPSKTIRMVVGYPAGSGIDTVARQVAHSME